MEYVDDVCLGSHKFEHMCRKLDDLWKESNKAGLEINFSKTEDTCQYNSKTKALIKWRGHSEIIRFLLFE